MKTRINIFAFALALVAVLGVSAVAQTGVKGKVRNTRGQAIAGVLVTARKDGSDVKSVKTDSDGKFTLTGLSSGTYNFIFDKTGYALGMKSAVEVKSGQIKDLGDRLILSVDSGMLVLINGSVFDQDGRSITGAKVEIVKISGGSEKKLTTLYTNVSGEFSYRQPEGDATFRITATLRGVSASKELVVNSAARYRLAITLNLPRNEEEKKD